MAADGDDNGQGRAAPGRSRRRGSLLTRSIKRVVGFLVLVLVVQYLVLPTLAQATGGLDDVLDRVQPSLLVAGALLQVLAYLTHAQLTRAVLPEEGRPGLLAMSQIEVASRAISHVVPGGTAAGTALQFRLLRQRGVSGSDAAFAAATQGIGSAVVLNVMLWLALVVSIPLRGFNPYYVTVAGLGVLLLGGFAALVVVLLRAKERAGDVVHRVIDKVPFVNPDTAERVVYRVADRLAELSADPPLLRRAVAWAAVSWLFDATSLWVFLAAFDQYVAADALFVAFGVANVLAAVPITPRGLGLVETALQTLLVGFGVRPGAALVGIAAYRLVNFWLPIPIGAVSYLSLRLVPPERPLERAKESLTGLVREATARSEAARQWGTQQGTAAERRADHPAEKPPVDD